MTAKKKKAAEAKPVAAKSEKKARKKAAKEPDLFTPMGQVEAAFRRIADIQQMVTLMDEVVSLVRNHQPLGSRTDYYKLNVMELRSCLFEIENREYQSAAMFGLACPPDVQARLRAEAYSRFFGKGRAVASWFSSDGLPPGHWLVADEVKFKTMVAEAFLSAQKDVERT